VEKSLGATVKATDAVRVAPEHEADLVLEIDGGGITLNRFDIHLRDIRTPSPRLNADDVNCANFPDILNAIARFNFFLSQTSKHHPHAGNVQVDFYSLVDDDDSGGYHDDDALSRPRKLKERVPFKNDEAELVYSDQDYAFVLHNGGTSPLYPYLVYFDTGTYEISTWYTPFEDKPTLLPDRSLQIGASPEHRVPFSFFIREGDRVDTSIVKIFLLDTPTQMGFIDQAPVVGRDEDRRSYVAINSGALRVALNMPTPYGGGWDVISRKMTVHIEDGVSSE